MRRWPWVTLAVGVAALAVYVWSAAAGPLDVDSVVRSGGKVGALIVEGGEVWRLASANLLHRDGLHLGLNLLALLCLGALLERTFGRLDCVALLVAAGLSTMTCSLLWSETASVGASGLVYGCLGALVAFGRRHRKLLGPRARRLLGEAALPTLLLSLWVGWTSVGVDNAGHLGGLAAGLAVGHFLVPLRLAAEEGPGRRWRRAGVVVGLSLAGAMLGVQVRSGWRVERDDAFGVSVAMPEGWRRGADRQGRLAFTNGLPGRGRATFSAEAIQTGEPGAGEPRARRFREALVSEAEEVRGPEPARVDGRPALRLQAALRGPGGVTRLVALFVPRGEQVYQFVLTWPEDSPRYASVVERMISGLRFEEPSVLREARGRALLLPGAPEPLRALGEALRRWGQPEEAVEPLARAVRLLPSEVGTRVELSRALLESGRVEEGCRAAEDALVYGPSETRALEAGVRCELARGDVRRALGRLEAARRVDPLDGRLRAAEAALRATLEASGP